MIEYAWINSWNKVSPVNKGVIDVVACFSNSENWNDLFNDMKTIKRLKQRLAHSELSRSILFSQKCFYRNNAFVQHFFPHQFRSNTNSCEIFLKRIQSGRCGMLLSENEDGYSTPANFSFENYNFAFLILTNLYYVIFRITNLLQSFCWNF